MKKIGLIGGMSSESSVSYYQLINKVSNTILGKHNTVEIILLSLNFNTVVDFMHHGEWLKLAELLIDAARRLEKAGADVIAICCNSAHKVFEQVSITLNVPFLHILNPTVQAIKNNQISCVGLLGNKFTMEDDFYRSYIEKNCGIESITPYLYERNTIHRIIYDELCHGIITEKSRMEVKKTIYNLIERGAKGIILGCTELPLLIQQEDFNISVFNTTKLHAIALANYSSQPIGIKNDDKEKIENIRNRLYG